MYEILHVQICCNLYLIIRGMKTPLFFFFSDCRSYNKAFGILVVFSTVFVRIHPSFLASNTNWYMS